MSVDSDYNNFMVYLLNNSRLLFRKGFGSWIDTHPYKKTEGFAICLMKINIIDEYK